MTNTLTDAQLARIRARTISGRQPRDDDSVMQPIEDRRSLLALVDSQSAEIARITEKLTAVALVRDAWQDRARDAEQLIVGLRRWQDAALSWLRSDDSPSALALRRDADDPMLTPSVSP